MKQEFFASVGAESSTKKAPRHRKSVSINAPSYAVLKEWSTEHGISMARLIELMIATVGDEDIKNTLEQLQKPAPPVQEEKPQSYRHRRRAGRPPRRTTQLDD